MLVLCYLYSLIKAMPTTEVNENGWELPMLYSDDMYSTVKCILKRKFEKSNNQQVQ